MQQQKIVGRMYEFHFICYSCHIIPVRYDLFAIGHWHIA